MSSVQPIREQATSELKGQVRTVVKSGQSADNKLRASLSNVQGIQVDTRTWACVDTLLMRALRLRDIPSEHRAHARTFMHDVAALLLSCGATTVDDLEDVYLVELAQGGEYHGPATRLIRPSSSNGSAGPMSPNPTAD